MYSMWLLAGPAMNFMRPEIRRQFWKPLLGALLGACFGMMVVMACLGTGPITVVRWIGAVFGNTVGLFFVLPVLLEIGGFIESTTK
jgi:hypothetical protein